MRIVNVAFSSWHGAECRCSAPAFATYAAETSRGPGNLLTGEAAFHHQPRQEYTPREEADGLPMLVRRRRPVARWSERSA